MSSTNTMNKKDHCIKFELGISCFSSCKCYYVLFNLEDWENIIHYGNLFASIGKKTYFLALGTIPVTGVSFIGRKNTELCHRHLILLNFQLRTTSSAVNNLIDDLFERKYRKVGQEKNALGFFFWSGFCFNIVTP